MKELRDAGFQTRDIADLVSKAHIERVKPGLYRLAVHEAPSKMPGWQKSVVLCRTASFACCPPLITTA